MKKIALLNDTYEWYHWGCTATSSALRVNIENRGCKVLPIPITMVYAFRGTPEHMAQFDDPNFFKQCVSNNPMLFKILSEADELVVNGEGTIHSIRPASLNLLYLSYACKKFLGKRVSIINHSAYPSPSAENEMANQLYRLIYQQLDFIAIREHISHALMTGLGVEATLSFDCLPLTARDMGVKAAPETDTVVVSDSVIVSKDDMRPIERLIKNLQKKKKNVIVLSGAKNNPGQDMLTFVNHMKEKFKNNITFVNASSLDQWFSTMGRGEALISGRFHYTIAAACLGTPFILFDTNTTKNRALAETFGADAPIGYDTPYVADRVTEMLDDISKLPVLSDEKREELVERAGKNFLFLEES